MDVMLDISINLKNNNFSFLYQIIHDMFENSDIKYYEFDSWYKTHKVYNIHVINNTSVSQNQLWLLIYKIKKIRGVFIESIYDNNKNKMLFSSSYHRKFLTPFKSKKRVRGYSETDAHILDNYLKRINI